MYERIIKQDIVYLKPDKLTSNYKQNILEEYISLNKNKCSESEGYITSIDSIVSIDDNMISNGSSYISFTVNFDMMFFKPKVNTEYSSKVCMIFVNGIFVNIEDKFKVLIPNDVIEHKYDRDNNIYKNETTGHIINLNDTIKILLTDLKYVNKNFIGIGNLKKMI